MPQDVSTYMRLYVGDWLEAVADLSLPEEAAYHRLICHMWKRDGHLPLDHDRLARICKSTRSEWDSLWVAIQKFFTVDPTAGTFSQKRLQEELTAAKIGRAQRSSAGAASAKKRAAAKDAVELPLNEMETENERSYPSSVIRHPSSESLHPSSVKGDTRSLTRSRPLPKVVMDNLAAAWEEKYGAPYLPTAADRSQLGRLVAKCGADHLPEIEPAFARYLADDEPFLAEKIRHSVAFFCTNGWNKYRVEPQSSGLSERERRGVRNTEAWLDMHGAANDRR